MHKLLGPAYKPLDAAVFNRYGSERYIKMNMSCQVRILKTDESLIMNFEYEIKAW